MAPKALTKALIKKKELIFGLLFLISLTLLGYQKYWGNVWYLQDDYFTVDLGGMDSIWGAGEKMTTWLYREQKRYQPVRFLLFSLATHLVPEEYSFFYNFGLHLVNVVLLFLLIRAFRVNNYLAFITSVVFSVYGVFRMIESPSAMIGGSGLNAFFIFLTLLYLKWSLESSSTSRKYTLLTLSYLSYLGLVFSYEVAFPMFATIVFFRLVVFNAIIQGQSVFSNPKKLWVLIPYFGALGAYYLLFCRQPTPYDGADITISLAIFTRFLSYSKALLEPFTRFKFFLWPEIVIGLIIYYGGIYLIRRQAGTDDNPDAPLHPPRNPISLFLFGVVWYLSSVLLFILNNWISPTAVMHHHLYLMTPGVAMIICGLIFYFDYIFFSRWKNIFQWFLIYAVFPLFIINSMNFNLNYGSHSSEKTRVLFNVKKQIQNYIPDINDVDALLLINFLKPQNLHYYQISHLNGALLHWFNFKKYIESGDNVLSVKDGQITFEGPLSYYGHILHSKTLIVSNKKVEMLYYDSDQKKNTSLWQPY